MSTEVTFRIHLNLVKRLSLVAENVNDPLFNKCFCHPIFVLKVAFFYQSYKDIIIL